MHSQDNVSLWRIALIISLAPVAGVFISPALPSIARYFHQGFVETQLLIVLYVMGFAIGQLVYTPFLNCYGRKRPLFCALGIFLLSTFLSILATYTDQFTLLLASRVLMAIGAAPTFSIVNTIINEHFPQEKLRHIMSYALTSMGVFPSIAIIIGGLLTEYVCWKACFYALSFYGIVVFYLISGLPETFLKQQRSPIRLQDVSKRYCHAFSNTPIMLLGVIVGLVASINYLTAGLGPFIGIKKLALSPLEYSLFVFGSYIGQFLGAWFSSRFSTVYSIRAIVQIGFAVTLTGTVIMLGAFWFNFINIFTFFLPLSIIMFGMPIIWASLVPFSLSEYHDKAMGSSVVSFAIIGTMACVTFSCVFLPEIVALTLPVYIFVAQSTALVLYLISLKVLRW